MNAGKAITATTVTGSAHTASAVADNAKGFVMSGTPAANAKSEGVGLYVEANLGAANDFDDKVYAFGSWVNITGTCVPADSPDAIVSAGDFGIYSAPEPTLSDALVRVLNLEYQVHGSAAAEVSSMIHFNTDAAQDVPDYLFTFGNGAAAAYTVDTGTVDTKAGAIKINITGHGDRYIWLYTGTGT